MLWVLNKNWHYLHVCPNIKHEQSPWDSLFSLINEDSGLNDL